MPTKPQRSVRIADAVWKKVQSKASAEGKTASEVINDYLKDYIK
jgi:macrodomain Ter protein organizer (MatP/YcbG family)